jgi:hypothetical protein
MKVEKNRILLCYWLPTKTHHKNTYLGHFFHEKSVVKVEIIFFKSKFGKILLIKEMIFIMDENLLLIHPWLTSEFA